MIDVAGVRRGDQNRALWLSTIAFTVCFAVWTIFSIIGVQIKKDLGLSDTQFGLLVGTPILTGSLIRLMLGVWADQYGGRIVYTAVMLSAAVATWLLTFAYDYPTFLLAALGVGIAGGSFAVGITYVSKWYPQGEPGHRARHLRRRQRRRGRHQIRRTVHHGGLWLEGRRQRVGDRDRAHGCRLLADDQGRSAARSAPAQRGQARVAAGHAGAVEERPGVALLALLFLRVRRLRGARAVVAALPDRSLRPRHHYRRHDRCRLLGAGQPVPRLRRGSLRQVRRAPGMYWTSACPWSAASSCPTRRPNTWCRAFADR